MQTRAVEPGLWSPSTGTDLSALIAWLPRLQAHWRHRTDYVLLDTAFGAGERFLALWQAWLADSERCQRLHVVALESRPLTARDMAQVPWNPPTAALAGELVQAWPPLTPNLHLLDFEQGRVRLTLAFGEVPTQLKSLRVEANALVLSQPAANDRAQVWALPLLKSMSRLAAPGALVRTAQTSDNLLTGLRTAGFELLPAHNADPVGASTWTLAAPRFAPRRLPSCRVQVSDAIVVGAGLAGAAVAQALAQHGLTVTVLEREAGPAQAASGNPAGLFHGAMHPQDGLYARLYRSAALVAASTYRRDMQNGQVAGQVAGLLRQQDDRQDLAGMRRTLRAQGLPSDYVQALDAAEASTLAGVALQAPCWFYPSGGWVSPPDWVNAALRSPGVKLRTHAAVERLERSGQRWLLLDSNDRLLAQSELVVLSQALQAARILQALGAAAWPLSQARGQVTHWPLEQASTLRLPVAGEGYALPLQHGLLCGATRQDQDTDPAMRHDDHLHNVARLQRLTGLAPPENITSWQGRVGWRLQSDDRMPIAGPLPLLVMPPGQRLDQARMLPRERGLFVLTALGSRGLSLAPLLGRLVAAQALGTPWPMEQDLVDAIDPGRWTVRAARRQAATA